MHLFQLGCERLFSESNFLRELKGRRVALLGHPASVNRRLQHTLDVLFRSGELRIVSCFGPQHGMRGEKQDNMVESDDYRDPVYQIPVHSLYGRVRRPTPEMLDGVDVILVDLQDVGCRIYTFLTTLLYILEACHGTEIAVWVLDRPNPAGRSIEGQTLRPGYESFVGAATLPMRHGLTLGEAALWHQSRRKLDLEVRVIEMQGYDPALAPGYGWCPADLPWVNPSPNLPRLTGVRAYPGTVLLEGTWLSEGRGTTIPLEVLGHPQMDGRQLVQEIERHFPDWLKGCLLRPCYFEPTFQKHSGKLCSGFQVHLDQNVYDHLAFRPYRLIAAALKVIRQVYPDLDLFREPPYEYEDKLMPIDILAGGPELREWISGARFTADDLEGVLQQDEAAWAVEREPFLLYPS